MTPVTDAERTALLAAEREVEYLETLLLFHREVSDVAKSRHIEGLSTIRAALNLFRSRYQIAPRALA